MKLKRKNVNLKRRIMTEDFVTYELAVKLKEKGFIGNGDIGCRCGIYTDSENYIYDDLDNSELIYGECLRFTISQVLKWLREKHKIHIEISIINHDGRILWTWCIYDIESGDMRPYNGSAESFEKAVLAGIEYVLDNLI